MSGFLDFEIMAACKTLAPCFWSCHWSRVLRKKTGLPLPGCDHEEFRVQHPISGLSAQATAALLKVRRKLEAEMEALNQRIRQTQAGLAP